jgi:hypothetical protein
VSNDTAHLSLGDIAGVERHVLPLREQVQGVTMEVELLTGRHVRVFRADDAEFYFCHGLSFGGIDAPGGPVSPYSDESVKTILREFFIEFPESNAMAGDIVVWWNIDGNPSHSAVVVNPIIAQKWDKLDYESVLRSKNGSHPERTMSLGQLCGDSDSYGEAYRVYRYAYSED